MVPIEAQSPSKKRKRRRKKRKRGTSSFLRTQRQQKRRRRRLLQHFLISSWGGSALDSQIGPAVFGDTPRGAETAPSTVSLSTPQTTAVFREGRMYFCFSPPRSSSVPPPPPHGVPPSSHAPSMGGRSWVIFPPTYMHDLLRLSHVFLHPTRSCGPAGSFFFSSPPPTYGEEVDDDSCASMSTNAKKKKRRKGRRGRIKTVATKAKTRWAHEPPRWR